MKSKIIQIVNPCSENWDKMQSNDDGRFCNLCSKNIIDFTTLDILEISKELKKKSKSICARTTKNQLNSLYLNLEKERKFNIIYPNIATSVLLCSTLVSAQPKELNQNEVRTEIVFQNKQEIISEVTNSQSNQSSVNDFIDLKGKILDSENGESVINAKITFFTLKEMFTTFSINDGTFTLKIPSELIDNDNVLSVSYYTTIDKNGQKQILEYEDELYIITSNQFKEFFIVKSKPKTYILGKIKISPFSKKNPILILNGKETDYNKFKAMVKTEKNNKKINLYYFETEFAIALYGNRACDGLYIGYKVD